MILLLKRKIVFLGQRKFTYMLEVKARGRVELLQGLLFFYVLASHYAATLHKL